MQTLPPSQRGVISKSLQSRLERADPEAVPDKQTGYPKFSTQGNGHYGRPYTPFVPVSLCFRLTFNLAIDSQLGSFRLVSDLHILSSSRILSLLQCLALDPQVGSKLPPDILTWVCNGLLLDYRLELLAELCKTPCGCQNWPCASAATWRQEWIGFIVSACRMVHLMRLYLRVCNLQRLGDSASSAWSRLRIGEYQNSFWARQIGSHCHHLICLALRAARSLHTYSDLLGPVRLADTSPG